MRGLGRRAGLWLPVLAWCALIYAVSDRPVMTSGLADAYDVPLRKTAHLVEYAILWLLARRAFAGSGAGRPGPAAFVLAVLYAASDEWHQTFVPGRMGRPSDVLVDSAGAGLAWLVLTRRLGRSILRG